MSKQAILFINPTQAGGNFLSTYLTTSEGWEARLAKHLVGKVPSVVSNCGPLSS